MVDGLAGNRSALICKVHHCIVDGIEVSDLGLIALAQLYGREWFDFLEEMRFEEKMQTRTLAHVI